MNTRFLYDGSIERRYNPLKFHPNSLYLRNKCASVYHTSPTLLHEHTETSIDVENANDLRTRLRGTNIYFVGMMGSGKSTIAKEFAKILDYRFLDTDEVAEYMIEMPIPDFFAQGSVDEFRQVEHQILMEMAQYTRLSLATGGGIVEKSENWGMLHHGLVVFLDLPPNDIYKRLSSGDPTEIQKRPLLAGADPLGKLQELSEKRRNLYLQADVHVNVTLDQTPQQVTNNVVKTLLEFIKSNPPLWETWKKKREYAAVEAAARVNPSATAKAGVGFGENGKLGTIQHVTVQDLESGRVKLPGMKSDTPKSTDSHINTSGKGFHQKS